MKSIKKIISKKKLTIKNYHDNKVCNQEIPYYNYYVYEICSMQTVNEGLIYNKF